MDTRIQTERRILEVMLILVTLGMTCLFYVLGDNGMVALNLFFLPVLLGGYYLGRNSAGVLALLCALTVTIATTLLAQRFVGYHTPAMIGLALTIWAAALGLSAILIGTLCDERNRTVDELHKAYVGVVEVLWKYLQSANPDNKARSIRVAELCQRVARELRLPRKQIDDIRVAALLHDLENIEVTTQVINRAVSTLEKRAPSHKHTFLGTDLVDSLGSVLDGALPLIVSQNDAVSACLSTSEDLDDNKHSVGARIICAVRGYDAMVTGDVGTTAVAPAEAAARLRRQAGRGYDDVLDSLIRVIERPADRAAVPEAAAARV